MWMWETIVFLIFFVTGFVLALVGFTMDSENEKYETRKEETATVIEPVSNKKVKIKTESGDFVVCKGARGINVLPEGTEINIKMLNYKYRVSSGEYTYSNKKASKILRVVGVLLVICISVADGILGY